MCLKLNSLPKLIVFVVIACVFLNSLTGQTDFLSSLVYDPSKTYEEGDSVIPSEALAADIYTALQTVSGNKPPVSESGERINTDYWATTSEYTAFLASQNSAQISDVPDDSIVDTGQVANLGTPSEDTGSTGGGSDPVLNARLIGISTNALTSDSASIVAGIEIKSGTKKVVFQVQGDATYPGQGFVTNPILYIIDSSNKIIATVDDWASGPTDPENTSYYQTGYLSELQNSKYAMNGTKEAAIIMNLPVGTYTALVGSYGESAKAVLAAFEFDTSSSGIFTGISTNAIVSPEALMVAGIEIKSGSKRVVFQVQGDATYPDQGFVADPILYITDSAGKIIATVDDWASGPTDLDNTSYYQTGYLSELQNSKYAMNGTKEAAIIMNLPVGTYTALVGAKNDETAKAVIGAFAFD